MTRAAHRDRIVVERTIAAPIEEVFDAWSDPRGMAKWMCPSPDMKPATVKLDFEVGGRFYITMHGREQDFVHEGEYLAIERPHRLLFSWVSHFMPEGERDTRVEVRLRADSAGHCRLTLTHEGLPDSDAYAGHVDGWAEILRGLDALACVASERAT